MGSGPIPYGYARLTDSSIAIDQHAADIIRTLLSLREKKGYQATADALNTAEYTTPKGGKWTVGHMQGIERHAELYRTGVRKWDGVKAEQGWPILYQE